MSQFVRGFSESRRGPIGAALRDRSPLHCLRPMGGRSKRQLPLFSTTRPILELIATNAGHFFDKSDDGPDFLIRDFDSAKTRHASHIDPVEAVIAGCSSIRVGHIFFETDWGLSRRVRSERQHMNSS